MIYGSATGGFGYPKTFIIEDSDGNELTGVVVDKETIFDATLNDVREGKVFANDEGVQTGTKVIPAYHMTEGYQVVASGSEFKITDLASLDRYDFSKLQAIICPYSNSVANSVAANKVAINEKVYAVNSTESLSEVTRDSENKSINFGITNDSDGLYLLRYFTYKEIY